MFAVDIILTCMTWEDVGGERDSVGLKNYHATQKLTCVRELQVTDGRQPIVASGKWQVASSPVDG